MAKKVTLRVYGVDEIVIESCKTFEQFDSKTIKVNNAIIKLDGNIHNTEEVEI